MRPAIRGWYRFLFPPHLLNLTVSKCLAHVWITTSKHNQRRLGILQHRVTVVLACRQQEAHCVDIPANPLLHTARWVVSVLCTKRHC